MGCTNIGAENYNPDAQEDDGSCYFFMDCHGQYVDISINTVFWSTQIGFELVNEDSGEIIDELSFGSLDDQSSYSFEYCLEEGNYSFTALDQNNDGWTGGGSFDIELGCGDNFNSIFSNPPVQVITGFTPYTVDFEIIPCNNVLLGCTDSNYAQFNPNAQIDDGSCQTLLIYGCTDDNYYEFNPDANIDDGSCGELVNIFGCTNPNYEEYNPSANIDDGSFCLTLIIQGCTEPNSVNYNANATLDDGSCIYPTSFCSLPSQWNGNTGSNMTIFIPNSVISDLPPLVDGAYIVAISSSGLVVGSTNIYNISQTQLTIWGDDATTVDIDGALSGDNLYFQLVNGSDYNLDNDLYDLEFTLNGASQYISNLVLFVSNVQSNYIDCSITGCTDSNFLEYNPLAYSSDGSCLTLAVPGCIDINYLEFDINANLDDGSCQSLIVYGLSLIHI